MLEASGAGAVVRTGVPLWEWATPLADASCYPGGLENNRDCLEDQVRAEGLAPEAILTLYDPQTSSGLPIAVGGERAERLVGALEERGATPKVKKTSSGSMKS